MNQCTFCTRTHPHPRGIDAVEAGWGVAETQIGRGDKIVLIHCPDHVDQFYVKLEELLKKVKGLQHRRR